MKIIASTAHFLVVERSCHYKYHGTVTSFAAYLLSEESFSCNSLGLSRKVLLGYFEYLDGTIIYP